MAGPTLGGLAQNFGLEPLIGKTLALIADARLSGRADQAAITERILSITGEDSITIDQKHKPAWTGRLGARFLFRFLLMSNELPKLSDASGALPSRFVLLTMTRSFFGAEDFTLSDRLLAELPGIFSWALDRLDRFRSRGRFTQPAAGEEAMTEMEEVSSPVQAFITECCDKGAALSVACGDLYAAWKDWCKDHGREHPGTVQTFSRDLRAALPGIRMLVRWWAGGVCASTRASG